jgi:hypothetical protein
MVVARATLLAACVAAASGKRAGNTLMPQTEEDRTATLVQFTDPAAEAVRALTKESSAGDQAEEGEEDPASGLQLKNLRGMLGKDAMDAIYSDPREMEKHMRAVDPRLNASLLRGNTKDPVAFKHWCEDFKTGSRVADYASFKYDGPTSNRSVVFNLGSYKTGSTSVDVAVKKLGMKSCKVGWNGAAGRKAAFDGGSITEYQKCPINTPEAQCPGRDAYPVRDAQFACDVLGDAPWPFAWPTAMRAFPNAKFILSRQKTCKDWVYHVRGLWNAGSGQSTSSTCWCVLPPAAARPTFPSAHPTPPVSRPNHTSPPTRPDPTTTHSRAGPDAPRPPPPPRAPPPPPACNTRVHTQGTHACARRVQV